MPEVRLREKGGAGWILLWESESTACALSCCSHTPWPSRVHSVGWEHREEGSGLGKLGDKAGVLGEEEKDLFWSDDFGSSQRKTKLAIGMGLGVQCATDFCLFGAIVNGCWHSNTFKGMFSLELFMN